MHFKATLYGKYLKPRESGIESLCGGLRDALRDAFPYDADERVIRDIHGDVVILFPESIATQDHVEHCSVKCGRSKKSLPTRANHGGCNSKIQLFLGLNLLFVGRFESDPSSSESGSGSEQEEKPKLKKEMEKKKKSPEKKRKSSEPSTSKPPKKKAKVAVSPPFFSLVMFSVKVGKRKKYPGTI